MAAQRTAAALIPGRRLPMSYEEFLSRVGEDVHAEWVAGEVIVFMPPTDRHQAIVVFLVKLLGLFVDLFDLGEVRVAPLEMRARPDGPAREPDVLFVARAHLDRLTAARLIGPADLVVEIVSNDSVTRDSVDKFAEYRAAGVREYWPFDPRPGQERANFYRLAVDGTYQAMPLDADGRYHAMILPGFWFDPTWLWQDPLPKVAPLLAAMTRRAPGAAPGGEGA